MTDDTHNDDQEAPEFEEDPFDDVEREVRRESGDATDDTDDGPGVAAQIGAAWRSLYARLAAGWVAFRHEFNTEKYRTEVERRKPARPSEAADQHAAASLAESLVSTIAGAVVGLTITLSQILPFSTAFFKGLLRAGYRGLCKSTSADAIMHVADGNRIKHVPVVWDHETQRYELAAADEEAMFWNASSEGRNEYRTIGNVPAVWAASEANELGSHVQAQVAQAIDLGADEPLFETADVQHVTVQPDASQSPGEAVADGGSQVTGREIWDATTDSAPSDVVVPIGTAVTGEPEAAGTVVSMNKYYETYPSVADSEEMKQQEMRGKLAAQDEDLSALAQRMMLIAGAIVVLSLAAAFGLPILLGGGGGSGSGGSFIPLITTSFDVLAGGV